MKKQSQENPNWIMVFSGFVAFWGITACDTPAVTCADELGCIAVDWRDPIRIGVMSALSGEVASVGQDSQRGVELAVADRSSSLLDHQIELVVTDSGCTPKVAAVAAEIVIEDEDVLGVIGPHAARRQKRPFPLLKPPV
ncbi:MAG: ABC transporter substrate-binding protein [Chloroflexi bacterium]|nr:ABC transporter substrate-binding protein [Chloroflexota bacterium]